MCGGGGKDKLEYTPLYEKAQNALLVYWGWSVQIPRYVQSVYNIEYVHVQPTQNQRPRTFRLFNSGDPNLGQTRYLNGESVTARQKVQFYDVFEFP